jgi:hypothetical protein
MGFMDDTKENIDKAKDNIGDHADNLENEMHEKKGEAKARWDESNRDDDL